MYLRLFNFHFLNRSVGDLKNQFVNAVRGICLPVSVCFSALQGYVLPTVARGYPDMRGRFYLSLARPPYNHSISFIFQNSNVQKLVRLRNIRNSSIYIDNTFFATLNNRRMIEKLKLIVFSVPQYFVVSAESM